MWNQANKCIHFLLHPQHHAWHGIRHDIGLHTRGIQWDSRSSGPPGEVCRDGGYKQSNVGATYDVLCVVFLSPVSPEEKSSVLPFRFFLL